MRMDGWTRQVENMRTMDGWMVKDVEFFMNVIYGRSLRANRTSIEIVSLGYTIWFIQKFLDEHKSRSMFYNRRVIY